MVSTVTGVTMSQIEEQQILHTIIALTENVIQIPGQMV